MTVICPSVTVTTNDPHDYRRQIERVADLSHRLHVDLMDGEFTSSRSINPIQAWWPESVEADIHLMFRRPSQELETLVSLRPSLVILQAEAEGDIVACMKHLQRFGIKAGIALLQHSGPDTYREAVEIADHVMIFSGSLGHFGGQADMDLLPKIAAIKSINPTAEIGWDGGITPHNIARLVVAGIDVFDVGGFIQSSDKPAQAYAALVAAV